MTDPIPVQNPAAATAGTVVQEHADPADGGLAVHVENQGNSAIAGPLGVQSASVAVATTRAKSNPIANGQVSIVGNATAAALSATTSYPSGVLIRNLDAMNTVWWGKDSTVTNTNGMPLYHGEALNIDGAVDPSTIFLYAQTTLTVAYVGLGG